MALRVVHSPEEWAAAFASTGRRAVLTIGNFDGLHLGHRQILKNVIERARALRAVATAISFDPHPLKVVRPSDAPPQIQTLAQRLAGFDEMGLDAAVVIRFDLALSRRSPEDFIRWAAVENLRAREIHVGDNFRFGHQQAGDVAHLEELGRQYGFAVQAVPPVVERGEVVSSSAIRSWLQKGDVGRASRLLGRPFTLTGEIIPGTGTGRRLLFPTLNLAPEQELLPADGVYATETLLDARIHRSATNVGLRPTFDGTQLTVETHLLDFSGNPESGRMEIHFWQHLRPEQKFSSPDDLRAQIQRDLDATRTFFHRLDISHRPKPAL